MKTIQEDLRKPGLDELSKHPLLAKTKPRQPQVSANDSSIESNKQKEIKQSENLAKGKRARTLKTTDGQPKKRNRKKTRKTTTDVPGASDETKNDEHNINETTGKKSVGEQRTASSNNNELQTMSIEKRQIKPKFEVEKQGEDPTQTVKCEYSSGKVNTDIPNSVSEDLEIQHSPLDQAHRESEITEYDDKSKAENYNVPASPNSKHQISTESIQPAIKSPAVVLTRLRGIPTDKPIRLTEKETTRYSGEGNQRQDMESQNKLQINLHETIIKRKGKAQVHNCSSAEERLNDEQGMTANTEDEDTNADVDDIAAKNPVKATRKCINHIVNILHTKGATEQKKTKITKDTSAEKRIEQTVAQSMESEDKSRGSRRKKRRKLIVKFGIKKKINPGTDQSSLNMTTSVDNLVMTEPEEETSIKAASTSSSGEKIKERMSDALQENKNGTSQEKNIVRIKKTNADICSGTLGQTSLSDTSGIIRIQKKGQSSYTSRLTGAKQNSSTSSHPLSLVLKQSGKLSPAPIPLTPEIYNLLLQSKGSGGQSLIPSYPSVRDVRESQLKVATVKGVQRNVPLKLENKNQGTDNQDGPGNADETGQKGLDHSYTKSEPNTPSKGEEPYKINCDEPCREKVVKSLLAKKQTLEAKVCELSRDFCSHKNTHANLADTSGVSGKTITAQSPRQATTDRQSLVDKERIQTSSRAESSSELEFLVVKEEKEPRSECRDQQVSSPSKSKAQSPSKQVPFALRYGNKMYLLTTPTGIEQGKIQIPKHNTNVTATSKAKDKEGIKLAGESKVLQLQKDTVKSAQKQKAKKSKPVSSKGHSNLDQFVALLGLTNKHSSVNSVSSTKCDQSYSHESSKDLGGQRKSQTVESQSETNEDRLRKAVYGHRYDIMAKMLKMKHHGDVCRFLADQGQGNCLMQHQNCKDACINGTVKYAKVIQVFKHSDLECRFYMHYATINLICSASQRGVERWHPFSDYPCRLHMQDYDEVVQIDTLTLHPGFFVVIDLQRKAVMKQGEDKHSVFSLLAPYPPDIPNLPEDTLAIAIGEFKDKADVDEMELLRSSKCLARPTEMSKVLKMVLGEEEFKDVPACINGQAQAQKCHDTSPKFHSPKFYQPTLYEYFTPKKPPDYQRDNSQFTRGTEFVEASDMYDISFLMKSERKLKLSYDRRSAV